MEEELPVHNSQTDNKEGLESLVKVTGMYRDWFLDYASYVILERAIPAISDGLKPVQRRILHSMKDLDDGRYNKVANIVGHTMQYHPHGDASIADAMIQIGQKDLLIDMQGNWGNILTGDKAAASRYIEARLSKFALKVVFSPKVTTWQLSYDGRKKEPVNLPIKFPLLLVQGAEGIAVGLSTKILPHNFNELIDSSIKYLKGKKFSIFPDFQTGGIIDVQNYNDGIRGGKIRIRAKISKHDKNTLLISEIPYSSNTSSLIDSVVKANDKGKIKIKKIEDNTSSEVEILVHLPSGISLDKTIDALYAFTDCEVSISPLACVIIDNKPNFIGVSDMLRISTDSTVSILKKELELRLEELREQWHFASLERIFIENRIYRLIENEETWEGVIASIENGLKPFLSELRRELIKDDIIKLTDIKIKRISKFDIDKALKKIDDLEIEIKGILNNLENLIEFSINYFNELKNEYGGKFKRLSEIRVFDDVDAKKVVVRNLKLYVNSAEGFIGTSLRKDKYICDCSDIDDIIVFTKSGKMQVVKVDNKIFIEKDILHVNVFKKKDDRTIYNLVYKDGKSKISYMKRFSVTGITRDKSYDLTSGSPGSEIYYFTSNSNGEAEVITVTLRNTGNIKKIKWDIDFADLDIKGRASKGNIVTKNNLLKVELKEKGVSTLKPRKIWFDSTVLKLNTESRGDMVGEYKGSDRLLIVDKNAYCKTVFPEMTLHFDSNPIIIEKWIVKKPLTAIYYDSAKKIYYLKRFLIENENKVDKVIPENSVLKFITSIARPILEIKFSNSSIKNHDDLIINAEEFITIKGFKAMGNQLTPNKIKSVVVTKKLEYIEDQEIKLDELEVDDLEEVKDGKNQIELDF